MTQVASTSPRLIFRPELHASSLSQAQEDSLGPSPIDQASHHAHQVVIDAIVACQQEGWISPGDPAPLALTAWCTVHRLATLLLHGSLRGRMQEMQAVQMQANLQRSSHRHSHVGCLLGRGRLRRWVMADFGE